MDNYAIIASDVSKKYKLYNKPIDRIKDSFSFKKNKYASEFFALNDINFKVKKRETVGIIGKNGSGKSTLLKIITGVLTPTVGKLHVNGKISAILELGAGFNPDYTGLQNIYLSGTIMGFSKDQMDNKVSEIVDFADIGDFIKQPVKNYSSGMYVRLAFAVAISVDPDILIVDEALSVGDIRFQQKCLRKIEEMKKDKTILFVSHDLLQLNKFCDRLIWINEGSIKASGEPEDVSKQYQAFMAGSELGKYREPQENLLEESVITEIEPIDNNLQMFGDSKAVIKGISIFNEGNNKVLQTKNGEKIRVSIKVRYNEPLLNPIVGFTIKDRIGNIVAQTNTFILKENLEIYAEKEYVYNFSFKVPPLKKGNYTISPAIASGSQYEHTQHCWVHDALVLKVDDLQDYNLEGFMVLDNVLFDINLS